MEMEINRPRCVVWVPDFTTMRNIQQWAVKHGVELTPLDELHLTIIYSKNGKPEINDKNVPNIQHVFPQTILPPYKMELFGPPGNKETLVIHIPDFPSAKARNEQYMQAGAISDFPEYKSHVTVGKNFKGELPPPPTFPMVFVRECDWEHIQVDFKVREAAYLLGKDVVVHPLLRK